MLQPWFPDRNTSRAVLIGASTFQSADLPNLPAVAHNLDALEQVLTDLQHGVIGACTVLAEHDVTDAKVGVAIAQAARDATDLLLVYYAGHGVLDDDGQLHLARPDTRLGHVGWTSVSVELLKRDLSRARARARVLVLDCCFSGRAIAAMADSRSLIAGQLDVSGTYTLTSTTATAPSHAPLGKRYTSFTNALLGALAQPDPLTLDDIYRRVDSELASLGLPRPQRNATNNAATLALTRGPVIPSNQRLKPPEPPLVAQPNARHKFVVALSEAYRTWLVVGGAVGVILFVGSLVLKVGPSQVQVASGVGMFVSVLLLIGTFVFSIPRGRLEIDGRHLSVRRPLGPRAQVPWPMIRKISVFEVERPGLSGNCCEIEIELNDEVGRLLGDPFTPVPACDQPTYEFGDIVAPPDMVLAALHETVGSSTIVEEL